MLNKLTKRSTTETITSIVFVVLFLFILLSSFVQFTDKLIFESELILLYTLIKQFYEYGFLQSLKDSVCSWKRVVFIGCCVILELLFIVLFIEKCGSYTLMLSIFVKCSIVAFTGTITSYLYYVVWHKEIAHTFKVLCFSLGMVFMTVIPVGVVPDEGMHSFTAYRISNTFLGIKNEEDKITMRKTDGEKWLVSESGYYSNENYELYFESVNNENVDKTLCSYELPYTIGTNYLYVIPALGITIGRLLSLNTYQIYFLGRICNFLLYLFGMFYVIKKIPFKKMIFVVLSMLPVFLQLGVSNSYDIPINLMIMVIIVQSIRIFMNKRQDMNILDWFLLGISCLAMCFVKSHAYILVGLMPLLCLGMKKINESKHNKQILVCLCVLIAVGVVGVFILARLLPTVVLSDSDSYSFLYLLQNPKEIFAIAYNTLSAFDTYYLDSFIGKYLGYLDIYMPSYIIYMYYGILLFLFIPKDEERKQLSAGIKVVFTFVSLMTAAFAIFGMLLANSTIGDRMVLGMQGRYLLASVTLLFFVIEPRFVTSVQKKDTDIFCIFALTELFTTGYLMLLL